MSADIVSMEFEKPNILFKNPIQRIRDTIGLIIFIFAMIILFSGIGMLVIAQNLYGDPMTGYPVCYKMEVNNGASLQVEIPGLTKGNDYDVRIDFKVIPVESDPASSSIDLTLTGSAEGIDYNSNDRLKENEFNTTIESTTTEEFRSKLANDVTLTYQFDLIDVVEISSVIIEITLFENPNRAILKLFSTIGILFVFGGILFAVIGGIVAGKQRRNNRPMSKFEERSGNSFNLGKFGKFKLK